MAGNRKVHQGEKEGVCQGSRKKSFEGAGSDLPGGTGGNPLGEMEGVHQETRKESMRRSKKESISGEGRSPSGGTGRSLLGELGLISTPYSGSIQKVRDRTFCLKNTRN